MNNPQSVPFLQTLPGDDVRQIQWRFADRFDLQMLVQSTRSVARGVVAQLVSQGGRNSHEWTEEKNAMLPHFDASGISSVFIDQEFGGYIEGPKNLAMALCAFELAWVDGGAATCSLATDLALSPIHEKGTYEQKKHYMSGCVPGQSEKMLRGAFALTEPLPFIGVDAANISGKMRVAEWNEGEEPILEVEKRGRFITNMDFANFVTAAVDTDDERIKTSTMVILEDTDPGTFDKGIPTKKMVHQLSSTCDPAFKQKIPASRIIGGYTVKNGVIIPNYTHAEIIEAVFRRTRVTVGVMSSAKVLSAVEPVIRYHRTRYRGGEASKPGTPRYEIGVQQKEDATQRLIDVWAAGEASASLGFAAARLFDDYDPIERECDKLLEKQGVRGPRAKMKTFRKIKNEVSEFIKLTYQPESERNQSRYNELADNTLIQYQSRDPLAMILCPACKLWNTGMGANIMREAVSLVGGYGITEDCPGFLMQKWTDMQLEATYEGPEVVQRRQLSIAMASDLFLTHFDCWLDDAHQWIAKESPMGANTLAAGMALWKWTLNFITSNTDDNGNKLYHTNRQGSVFPLADALTWLTASRYQMLDILHLKEKGPENPVVAEGLAGTLQFFSDLGIIEASRAAGEVSRICSEIVHGYNLEPSEELNEYYKLRTDLDKSLAGVKLARDRAGESIAKVMIPEALDYPQQ